MQKTRRGAWFFGGADTRINARWRLLAILDGFDAGLELGRARQIFGFFRFHAGIDGAGLFDDCCLAGRERGFACADRGAVDQRFDVFADALFVFDLAFDFGGFWIGRGIAFRDAQVHLGLAIEFGRFDFGARIDAQPFRHRGRQGSEARLGRQLLFGRDGFVVVRFPCAQLAWLGDIAAGAHSVLHFAEEAVGRAFGALAETGSETKHILVFTFRTGHELVVQQMPAQGRDGHRIFAPCGAAALVLGQHGNEFLVERFGQVQQQGADKVLRFAGIRHGVAQKIFLVVRLFACTKQGKRHSPDVAANHMRAVHDPQVAQVVAQGGDIQGYGAFFDVTLCRNRCGTCRRLRGADRGARYSVRLCDGGAGAGGARDDGKGKEELAERGVHTKSAKSESMHAPCGMLPTGNVGTSWRKVRSAQR